MIIGIFKVSEAGRLEQLDDGRCAPFAGGFAAVGAMIVGYLFRGTELIEVFAAGESENPEKVFARGASRCSWRILLFCFRDF